jgi:hypothetical protein
MKTCGGVEVQLHLGTRWRCQLHARGKSPRYPLGGPQSCSGRCREEKISCPCRRSNHGRPARSPSLYRLRFPGLHWTTRNSRQVHVFHVCPTLASCIRYPALTGLRLKLSSADFKVKVPLRPTVSRSVSLGVEPHLGLMTRSADLQLRFYTYTT